MKKITVAAGVHWVDIPEADLFVLCGCPPDGVKHLIKRGLIRPEEKDGVSCETGPNAILLSDVPLQGERFCNIAEFPVLQMLYRQGMIIPNHPNNTGRKPLLIGIEHQVKAQSEYIFRGNYGLLSEDELTEAGLSRELSREMLRLKLRFAFDRMRATEELLETRVVGDEPVELRNGACIRRRGNNLFELSYGSQSVLVDLSLAGNEEYEAPYPLSQQEIKREYFSVLHIGEGDGWDIHRPCMGSILTFQGKLFLIDAGPNIIHSLRALGVSANDIEGIFNTHCHDDHFIGLPALFRSDHKIRYLTTRPVRSSVDKKLSALLSMKEGILARYLEIQDLEEGKWNDLEGLEVMPVFSPHPVETNVLFFRTPWVDGYATYAHLADIASLDVLERMVTVDSNRSGISERYFREVKKIYLTPVDVKKVDVGGGLIHGNAEDFVEDKSGKIILSHTSLPLTDRQKEIGTGTTFGTADVLISSDQDLTKASAYQHLQSYFPSVPKHELRMLLNCPVVSFSPGTFLLRRGDVTREMFFILSGILEFIASDAGIRNRLSAGSFAGEMSGLTGTEPAGTYRAFSFVKALKIPCALYLLFLKRNHIYEDTIRDIETRSFLQGTWLLGEMISCPVKSRIARSMKRAVYPGGQDLPPTESHDLLLVEKGEIEVFDGNRAVELQGPGGFFGEERVLFGSENLFHARTTRESTLFHLPGKSIEEVPIVRWKLFETYERRLRLLHLKGVDS